MKGEFKFYSPKWGSVSNTAKSFINALLTKDPKKRLSAADALKHPWLNEYYPTSKHHASQEMLQAVHDSIVRYGKFNDLKKIGLNIIAHQIETDHVKAIRNAFDAYDVNKGMEIAWHQNQVF